MPDLPGVMNEIEASELMPLFLSPFIYLFFTAKLSGSVPLLPNNVQKKNECIHREMGREKERGQGEDRGSSTMLPAALQQKSTQHTTTTTQPPALHRIDPRTRGEE